MALSYVNSIKTSNEIRSLLNQLRYVNSTIKITLNKLSIELKVSNTTLYRIVNYLKSIVIEKIPEKSTCVNYH